MRKLAILTLLLILSLSESTNSETVTTDNLLSNSTFGTGTTYDSTGWTISSGTSGHGNITVGGGNDPGGSVASTGNTNIEQTVSSVKTAAGMTVNEIRKGWSSTLSTDIWYWNSHNNTTTLKQTITDNEGNVSTQQRVITDTGCGSNDCGQYANYTDTHIQGSNTKDDFSIKVGVSNSNSLNYHQGPDIDDIQLKITYTDVPPIEEDTQEELDEITEGIDDVVEDIEDNIVWEDDFTFEEEYAWEEDFYFEEDFNTNWEEFDTAWEDYEMEFDDNLYFEMEEEFVEFEEFEDVGMPEFEEFETVMMPENTFEDMYMEEFDEFEEFEDAWEMEPEMTEMDTFFNEMTDDDWQELEEMSEDEFTEFLEEEFPEEFAEIQEEMEMEETPMEEETVFEEEEIAMTEEMEEPEEAVEEPEEMTEDEPTETEVTDEPEESADETTDDVEEESEPEESPQEVDEDENKPDTEEDRPSEKITTEGIEEKKVTTKTVAKIDVAKIKEIIVEEVKVDLFSNQESLREYSEIVFYQPEQIYTDVDTSFFDQINMIEYNKEIYQNVRLASYMDNDPVEVHRKNMERINTEKQRLLIELQQLKNQ